MVEVERDATGPAAPGGRFRRLNEAEIEAYDLIPTDLAVRVRVVRLPMPGPYAGITFGRVVVLGRDVPADGGSSLLAHELVHVRQWSDLGVIGFSARYLSQFASGLVRLRSWKAAYHQIGAEREARASAEEWRRRKTL